MPIEPHKPAAIETKAWLGLASLILVIGFLIFAAAGTFRYWQAWSYIVVYFVCSLLVTLYAIKNDPALLARRMSGGPTAEKRMPQRIIMTITSVGFVAMMIVPGLDHRYRWSSVPAAVSIAGDVLTASWFYLVYLIFKENPFASATVEVADDQRVISTGPYAIVRHPMYAVTLLLFVGTPLALGSYWGLLAFAATLPAVLWRLLDEERFLAKDLPGYEEYCAKVRWRLVPGVF
jgi:protein-S-isoprenylcysteine O-methyltransferase Ste14